VSGNEERHVTEVAPIRGRLGVLTICLICGCPAGTQPRSFRPVLLYVMATASVVVIRDGPRVVLSELASIGVLSMMTITIATIGNLEPARPCDRVSIGMADCDSPSVRCGDAELSETNPASTTKRHTRVVESALWRCRVGVRVMPDGGRERNPPVTSPWRPTIPRCLPT